MYAILTIIDIPAAPLAFVMASIEWPITLPAVQPEIRVEVSCCLICEGFTKGSVIHFNRVAVRRKNSFPRNVRYFSSYNRGILQIQTCRGTALNVASPEPSKFGSSTS